MSHAPVADARGSAAPRGWFARAAVVVRRIIGAPDYSVYLAHVKECHPDRVPMSEREFEQERLTSRYEKPGSRCC